MKRSTKRILTFQSPRYVLTRHSYCTSAIQLLLPFLLATISQAHSHLFMQRQKVEVGIDLHGDTSEHYVVSFTIILEGQWRDWLVWSEGDENVEGWVGLLNLKHFF